MTGAAIELTGYARFVVIVFVVHTDPSSWVGFASRADAVGGAVLAIALTCSFALLLLALLDRRRTPEGLVAFDPTEGEQRASPRGGPSRGGPPCVAGTLALQCRLMQREATVELHDLTEA